MLFSGDTNGNVSVWDTKLGSLLHTFPAHIGHVLTLISNLDKNVVFSGGADALVRRYEYSVSTDGQASWELSATIRGCRRDIRGLVYLPGQHLDPGSVDQNLDSRFEPHRLLAVGLDARLIVLACEHSERGLDGLSRAHHTLACQVGLPRSKSSAVCAGEVAHVAALPFWPSGCAPTRPAPVCFISKISGVIARLCLLHYPDHLSLVRLAEPVKLNTSVSGLPHKSRLMPMREGAVQLAEIRPRKNGEMLTSALSSCGAFVAYSDSTRTRVLKVNVSSAPKRTGLPRVTIERLPWMSNELKRTERKISVSSKSPSVSSLDVSRTSSSGTDSDSDDLSPGMAEKYFALDQPLTGVSTASTGAKPNSPDALWFPKMDRKRVDPGLPPAHCLGFSTDSRSLLMVTSEENLLCCFSLETGKLLWQSKLDQKSGDSFRVHGLTVSPLSTTVGESMIALSCSDGRVRLYSSETGQHLFTCGCVSVASGHIPLPTHVTFDHEGSSLSILYTNSQLYEWQLSRVTTNDDVEDVEPPTCRVMGKLNLWLAKFGDKMKFEMTAALGVLHSAAYLNRNQWLLASDNHVAVLTRNKNFGPGMIYELLGDNEVSLSDCCINVSKSFESVIQATALSDNEIAVVSLYSAGIALKLNAPMQRKQFGT